MTVFIAAAAVALPATGNAAEWTVSAFLGAVHTERSALRVVRSAAGTDLVFPDTPFSGRSLESPWYYGYRVGRSVYRHRLFVEGELIHAKVFAEPERGVSGAGRLDGIAARSLAMSSVVQRFAMSHGLNFVLANVVVRQPLNASRIELIGRAGASVVVPHGETTIEGTAREGYELAGVGLQAAVGLEVPIWHRLKAAIEYKLTRARPAISIDGGKATMTAVSHHVAAGVTWTFGK